MSLSQSISFVPGVTPLSAVIAAVNAAYSVQSATLATGLAGANVVGDDTDDAPGTVTSATHDNTGLPWDARIHSDPASLTDKGVWRKRRGVAKELVATVEQELRNRTAAAGLASAAASSTAGAAVQQTQVQQQPLQQQTQVQQPALQPMGQLPAIQQPMTNTPYSELVTLITANLNTPQNPAGRMPQTYLDDGLRGMGFNALQDVAQQPHDVQLRVLNSFRQALGLPPAA